MTFQSLYRRYRPKNMDDMVDQTHIVSILKNAIKKEKIAHAYLFTGPRGTGKTSMAQVFSRAVNCTSKDSVICGTCENCLSMPHPDIIEIDAASNNGVDEIRSLIERVKYSPILGKYKVYIIDEVHMLSQSAFNALLKTLEEPPEHVIFILATTEVHKVLPTIISRCQRFDFMRISNEAIEGRLQFVLDQEGASAEAGVLKAIARLSQGGLRNALTILEQAIVLSDDVITLEQIYETHGLLTEDKKIMLFKAVLNQDVMALQNIIEETSRHTVHMDQLLLELVHNVKDSIILSSVKDHEELALENLELLEFLSQHLTIQKRQTIMDSLLDYIYKMKQSFDQRLYMELALLSLVSYQDSTPTIQHEQKQKTVQNKSVTQIENVQVKPAVQKEAVLSSDIVDDEIFEEVLEDVIETLDKEPLLEEVEADLNTKSSETNQTEFQVVKHVEALKEEFVVQLMSSGSKVKRMEDEAKFQSIAKYYTDHKWARISRLLDQASVVISSGWFVVLVLPKQYQVNELLVQEHHEIMHYFIEELLGSQREVYVLSQDSFDQGIIAFRKLLEASNLPAQLVKPDAFTYVQVLVEEETSMNRIIDLFGDDVKVIS